MFSACCICLLHEFEDSCLSFYCPMMLKFKLMRNTPIGYIFRLILSAVVVTSVAPPSVPRCGFPSGLTLFIGYKVTVTCKSDAGDPVPTYMWYKNGERLPLNDFDNIDPLLRNHSYSYSTVTGTLVFLEVVLGDEGTYFCEASNGVGSPQRCEAAKLTTAYENFVGYIVIAVGCIFGVLILLVILIKCFKGFVCCEAFFEKTAPAISYENFLAMMTESEMQSSPTLNRFSGLTVVGSQILSNPAVAKASGLTVTGSQILSNPAVAKASGLTVVGSQVLSNPAVARSSGLMVGRSLKFDISNIDSARRTTLEGFEIISKPNAAMSTVVGSQIYSHPNIAIASSSANNQKSQQMCNTSPSPKSSRGQKTAVAFSQPHLPGTSNQANLQNFQVLNYNQLVRLLSQPNMQKFQKPNNLPAGVGSTAKPAQSRKPKVSFTADV